jgi:GTPase SAR1 family protein
MSPTVIVCVGMAGISLSVSILTLGSGKTTFMQRLNVHLHSKRTPPYVLNLDPAVITVPYEANIDIRDSINYKAVMKQYFPRQTLVISIDTISVPTAQ